MAIFSFNAPELAWPSVIALAWVSGELGHRLTRLPRISFYGLIGFLMANSQAGFLSLVDSRGMHLLANIAFGLILFEFGYRINLRWLKNNPWIGVTGVVEAVATFVAIYYLSYWFGASMLTSLMHAALAMSTSPAGILRVINERHSSGQVTECILHLSALNCVLAVFAFNVIFVFWVSQITGDLVEASLKSGFILMASLALGGIFGLVVPFVLRCLGDLSQGATVAFAIAIILLVTQAEFMKLSPILSCRIFGLIVRHRRVSLNQTKRNFDVLGDLLTVMLFVYVASTIEWPRVVAGASLGLAIFVVRSGIKIVTSAVLAPISGITFRKGMLTGLGLAPISVFVILILEQTRYFNAALMDELVAIVTVTLLLDLIGPVMTQSALIWANETPDDVLRN